MDRGHKIIIVLLLLVATFISIWTINFGSALYQGETITVSSGLDNISGVIFVENTSSINYIQLNDSAISITIPEDYTAGTFHIVFYGYTNNNPDQQNIVYVGGGSHTIYKNVTQNVTNEVPIYINNNSIINITNTPAPIQQIVYEMPSWLKIVFALFGLVMLIAIIFLVINIRRYKK